MDNYVHFLGIRDDIPELLGASDIFVLPSIREGLPVAVIEAMAAGLPVVASNVGGLPDLIKHGVSGILFDKKDKQKFIEAIVMLANDQVLLHSLGFNAKEKVRMNFDVRKTMKVQERMYLKFFELCKENNQ